MLLLWQVLFSSVAALLGSPGQASYAAANGSMDALTSAWRGSGTPTTAIQWGPWPDIGMAAGRAGLAARAQRSGLGMLTPEQGLAALGGALTPRLPAAAPVVAAAPISWRRFLQQRAPHNTGDDADAFAEFSEGNSRPSATTEGQPPNDLSVSTAAGAGGLAATLSTVMALVRAAVSSVLGSEVSGSQPLMAAGTCGSPTSSLINLHACQAAPVLARSSRTHISSFNAALQRGGLDVVGWCTDLLVCCS